MDNAFITFTKEQLKDIDNLIEQAESGIKFASKMGMETSGMKADLRTRKEQAAKMRKAIEETEAGL